MANKKDQLTNDLSKYVEQAQWAKAVQTLQGLIELEPTNAQYHLRMGDYSVKAGAKGTLDDSGLAWKRTEREISSDVSTPLFYQDRFYVLNSDRKSIAW